MAGDNYKAKKGDFAVLEIEHSYHSATQHKRETYKTFQLVRIESATADGTVKKYIPAAFIGVEGARALTPANAIVSGKFQFYMLPKSAMNIDALYDWIAQMRSIGSAPEWPSLEASRGILASFRKGVRL